MVSYPKWIVMKAKVSFFVGNKQFLVALGFFLNLKPTQLIRKKIEEFFIPYLRASFH